ncbi:hypothetical protein KP509_27G045000 [Ceratopteris richardii]|uniref:Uncharacterized protein n=1 Tax=Ceratopteris richardii TaxID=49495 RepID=A0A8T2RIN8_CERRI|nr:hypothetical protein KP509_27G045000 [Ceratopteris richardii]
MQTLEHFIILGGKKLHRGRNYISNDVSNATSQDFLGFIAHISIKNCALYVDNNATHTRLRLNLTHNMMFRWHSLFIAYIEGRVTQNISLLMSFRGMFFL